MNYMKPEIEILEFEHVDVIQTSTIGDGTTETPIPDKDETPYG